MNIFIKVHLHNDFKDIDCESFVKCYDDGQVSYIAVHHIKNFTMLRDKQGSTIHSGRYCVDVKESPEELLRLIKNATKI